MERAMALPTLSVPWTTVSESLMAALSLLWRMRSERLLTTSEYHFLHHRHLTLSSLKTPTALLLGSCSWKTHYLSFA